MSKRSHTDMPKLPTSLITQRIITVATIALVLVATVPAAVFAHVTVTPAQAGTGSRTTFSVSVPNEKDIDVTSLRLVIPAGLEDVTPNVHPGWTISTVRESGTTGDAANDSVETTEIRWESGSIPAGQRDDFDFRARVPAKETSLVWKAYQTYSDGTTVAWDQKPANEHSDDEGGTSGPYSVTKVSEDATAASDSHSTEGTGAANAADKRSVNWAFAISLAAFVLSAAAFVRHRKA